MQYFHAFFIKYSKSENDSGQCMAKKKKLFQNARMWSWKIFFIKTWKKNIKIGVLSNSSSSSAQVRGNGSVPSSICRLYGKYNPVKNDWNKNFCWERISCSGRAEDRLFLWWENFACTWWLDQWADQLLYNFSVLERLKLRSAKNHKIIFTHFWSIQVDKTAADFCCRMRYVRAPNLLVKSHRIR